MLASTPAGTAPHETAPAGAGFAGVAPLFERPPRVVLLEGPRRAPLGERIGLAAAAAFALFVLFLASRVDPDPRGFGTHERLGLPPCGLIRIAGIPCPSCGMTTAFAHAVRLRPLESARAQPLGLLLAVATALVGGLGPVLAIAGTPVLPRVPAPLPRSVAIGLMASVALSWAYKIIAVRGGSP